MTEQTLYIGAYTTTFDHVDGRGQGIYRLRFSEKSGELSAAADKMGDASNSQISADVKLRNPTYLAYAPTLNCLYAVEELAMDEAPRVVAFSLDAAGLPTELNAQAAAGASGCHITIHPSERWLFVAHYMGGNVAVYPLDGEGRLGEATAVVQHRGTGPNAVRQEMAHAHGSALDRSGRYLFVADLGIDRVMVYALDEATGALDALPPAILAPGAGPRHIVVHPNNRFLYTANELDSSVTCFAHAEGALTPLQTTATVPAGFNGTSQPAAIRMTQDGRFLYVSNRIDENSIAAFAVDAITGALTPIGHIASGGRTPRDMILDRTERFLIVANQDSDRLAVFGVNPHNGTLTATAAGMVIPSPAGLAIK